ncbi:fimbrial protein [Enterobacter ludwigii]|uniref:fimbrial protein n=1 Tax=Enterobacter ludwigii TaxID=299767 RepID=UPI00186738A0|nr:fimbrial protein [Enterobacter ludwigii]
MNKCLWWQLATSAGMLFSLALISTAEAWNSTIVVTQTLTKGTCTIDSTAINGITLPDVRQAVFNSTDIKIAKSEGAKFTVNLKCDGAPNPSEQNILKVTGTADMADGSGKLFKNLSAGSSAATHLGFLLTTGSDGSGTPFDTTSLPISVVVGNAGDNVDGRKVDFYVMPSKGNYNYTDVTAGALTTTLTITWDTR